MSLLKILVFEKTRDQRSKKVGHTLFSLEPIKGLKQFTLACKFFDKNIKKNTPSGQVKSVFIFLSTSGCCGYTCLW